MLGKAINAAEGEVRKVESNWTAEAGVRGAIVATSQWRVSGGLTLGAQSLSGAVASAFVTVSGQGSVTNTVTLSNGETLKSVRAVCVPPGAS